MLDVLWEVWTAIQAWRMTGSAASAGRSMGGLFLEVYFKEVGGPGGGGGWYCAVVPGVADF